MISKELIEEIKEEIKSNNSVCIYWDYRGELDADSVQKIVDGKADEVLDELWGMNIDYICELEREAVSNAVEECVDKDLDDYWDILDEIKDECFDELLEYVEVDLNFDELLSHTEVPVRITLYSNYDCINSCWFEESGGGYEYYGYFKDIVDVLYLNPRRVKTCLTEQGIRVQGSFPDYKWRNGKEYVDYGEFAEEMANSCCGANLLVFTGILNLADFIGKEDRSIVIPKGNYCGLFSSFQGGGSLIEMSLRRDFKVKLDVARKGKTKYDHFSLVVDSQNKYSIQEVYGVTGSFWGGYIC